MLRSDIGLLWSRLGGDGQGLSSGAAQGTPGFARSLLQDGDDVVRDVKRVANRGTDELFVAGVRGDRDQLESRRAINMAEATSVDTLANSATWRTGRKPSESESSRAIEEWRKAAANARDFRVRFWKRIGQGAPSGA